MTWSYLSSVSLVVAEVNSCKRNRPPLVPPRLLRVVPHPSACKQPNEMEGLLRPWSCDLLAANTTNPTPGWIRTGSFRVNGPKLHHPTAPRVGVQSLWSGDTSVVSTANCTPPKQGQSINQKSPTDGRHVNQALRCPGDASITLVATPPHQLFCTREHQCLSRANPRLPFTLNPRICCTMMTKAEGFHGVRTRPIFLTIGDEKKHNVSPLLRNNGEIVFSCTKTQLPEYFMKSGNQYKNTTAIVLWFGL